MRSFVTGEYPSPNSDSDDGGFDTDVFVVGTGPMGGTTALLLATYGVRVTAISNYRWLANTPRAHITNQRAVEVFRDLGLEDELKRYAMPWNLMAATHVMTSFAGPELARIASWGGGEREGDYRLASPSEPMDLPQTFLEPIIVNAAAARGAKIAFNTQYLSHEQDGDGVTIHLRDRLSGAEYSQRARYLVGADGGSSTVAEHAGIEFVGERGKAGTVYARFTADLSRYVAHRPGVLYIILQPTAGQGDTGTGIMRTVRPWNEWIAGWGFDPKQGDPDLSDEFAMSQIRAFIGDPDLEVDFHGTSVWYVNEQYATSMSAGRVFIGGDAAHRHPPNNGLGSNTCVQDAYNLAWKLAMVINGLAEADLLESYSEERQPVAKQIVERANKSRAEFQPFREIFAGGEEGIADALDRLGSSSQAGAVERARLERAALLKRYEYSANGVELNQRYSGSAVIADGTPDVYERDPELYAQPTTRPGAKVPHVWLVDERGQDVSTLDLVGRGRFTVLTGIAGEHWRSAIEQFPPELVRAVTVGSANAKDLYSSWSRISGIDEGGALLVRPDGYVAWREAGAPESAERAASQLARVFGTLLGHDTAAQ